MFSSIVRLHLSGSRNNSSPSTYQTLLTMVPTSRLAVLASGKFTLSSHVSKFARVLTLLGHLLPFARASATAARFLVVRPEFVPSVAPF